MTLFEYLAIAFGLLFSLTALRLIGGLPSALDRERRYWVHLALVITILAATASAFWTFWSLSEVAWTLPRFLLALGVPGIMYLNAATLIPEDPADVSSWREYYYEMRVRLFAGITAWALVAAASTTVNLEMPFSHPARVVQAITVGIGLAGLSTSRHRVHAGLVASIAVIVVAIAVTVATSAGWLAG